MNQKKVLIILLVVFVGILFSSRTAISDKKIDIMDSSLSANVDSNKTISVTMHEPKSLHVMYISQKDVPIEKSLLTSFGNKNYGESSMPVAPMPVENYSSSKDKNKSDLFSFDTPKEEDNQNWGWIASAVNNADNYSDITPTKKMSGAFVRNYDSQSYFGGERESFFDDTLYGSDKEDNFLDSYDFNNSSSKDSDSSPYSTMSW